MESAQVLKMRNGGDIVPEISHWWLSRRRRLLTKNLLHMHDARVGTDVVDRVGLLRLLDIFLLEDIVECEGLLGSNGSNTSHIGRSCVSDFREMKRLR